MNPTDIATWYVKICNIETADKSYEHGEYILKIVIPQNYPVGKPEFTFVTQNGFYKVGHKICMASQTSSDILDMVVFVVSNMVCWRDQLASEETISTSLDEKKVMAAKSVHENAEYNKLFQS